MLTLFFREKFGYCLGEKEEGVWGYWRSKSNSFEHIADGSWNQNLKELLKDYAKQNGIKDCRLKVEID